MPNLSDHDLKQMDDAWQDRQTVPVVRALLRRSLEDLREGRDRANQTPNNSSRPSGSMAPWYRRGGAANDEFHEDDSTLGGGQPDAPASDAASPTGNAIEAGADGQAPRDSQGCDDPPEEATRERAKTKPRGRPGRRVGAPGHGRKQKIAPTRTHEHRPSECAACQAPLPSDGEVQAWTGWDMLELMPLSAGEDGAPPVLGVRIECTRHLLMEQRCSCDHVTQAQAVHPKGNALWPGVELSEQRLLGPHLAATVVWLCLRMRLSRRKVSELLLELFGLELSAALIDQTVHQAARSVAPLEEPLAQQLEQAAIAYIDETSWNESQSEKAMWLWVFCCCHTVLYVIGARTIEMLDNALSVHFGGNIMTDGFKAYRRRLLRLRCWAHLLRKARGLAESTDRHASKAGTEMLLIFEQFMIAVFEARANPGQAPPSVTHADLIERMHQLCELHRDASHKKLRELAREFLYDWDVIVRQLADPRLPLTNNAAERQLRHYVIARRISYGTRTPVGSHSVSLLASVIDTCRLRRASATDLLARAIHAARTGQPAPALPSIPADLLSLDLSLVAA